MKLSYYVLLMFKEFKGLKTVLDCGDEVEVGSVELESEFLLLG
jgi:hypothetical protein